MSNNSEPLTFAKLLGNYHVEIPIIQRDYAQGREGKEELRKNFLDSLHTAITTDDKLELDFVYGDVDKGIFKPLDGQQRLTTLFLLHWYAATKDPSITYNENILSKFTYETRASSREFCHQLVTKGISYSDLLDTDYLDQNKTKPKNNEISKTVENANWFFLSWKRDPTIKSMLRMLDSIHYKFKNQNLWNNLDHISFHFVELQNFGLSDDLYIKMNARGKPLTEFENFKAKFEQYIKKEILKKHENGEKVILKVNWEDGLDLKETFAHKIDTKWADLFWKHKKINENVIDFEILTFLSGKAVEYYGLKRNEKKIQELFNNPLKVTIEDFSQKNEFDNLIHSLDLYANTGFDKMQILKVPLWNYSNGNSLFLEFIKNKSNDKKIYTGATYSQRIIFYAQTEYLLEHPIEDENFYDWMRFVRNIVEHSTIDSPTTFISAIHALQSLLLYKNNILKNLKEGNCDDTPFFGTQIEEERLKAYLILKEDENNNDEIKWEELIEEAENHGMFRGNIGFLFDDDINSDYKTFKKWKNRAFEIFDENGVVENYNKNSLLMRALISQFDNWNLLWGKMAFDSTKTNWNRLLKNSKRIPFIQKLLSSNLLENLENMVLLNSQMEDEIKREVHRDLYQSDILSVLPEGAFLRFEYDNYVLYPYNTRAEWKKYVIGSHRNKILSDLSNKIETVHQLKVGDKIIPYFWGWDIYFQIENSKYVWKFNNKIINLDTQQEEVLDMIVN